MRYTFRIDQNSTALTMRNKSHSRDNFLSSQKSIILTSIIITETYKIIKQTNILSMSIRVNSMSLAQTLINPIFPSLPTKRILITSSLISPTKSLPLKIHNKRTTFSSILRIKRLNMDSKLLSKSEHPNKPIGNLISSLKISTDLKSVMATPKYLKMTKNTNKQTQR